MGDGRWGAVNGGGGGTVKEGLANGGESFSFFVLVLFLRF